MNQAFKRRRFSTLRKLQSGVTLIELMVGIILGMLVVAVATVALMASRGIAGTVSEASTLQQEASYAFGVIGRQIRQAGSIELNLKPNLSFAAAGTLSDAMEPVAFDAPDPTGARPPFDRKANTISGTATPSFTVGYQNYTETLAAGGTAESQLRDCLGQNPSKTNPASAPTISSQFQRNAGTNELTCTGMGGGGTQAVIENVTDMTVRYAFQPKGTANVQYTSDPTSITDWARVYAVEVCLELTGKESQPSTGTYKNCAGTDTSYGGRLKMVFRNVYQLRSQGVLS